MRQPRGRVIERNRNLDVRDPEVADEFRSLVARAAGKSDDDAGRDPVRTPVGQRTGPPELAAIWFAERGDFDAARAALVEAFASVSV
jgi:hypothetical protein